MKGFNYPTLTEFPEECSKLDIGCAEIDWPLQYLVNPMQAYLV